MSKTSRPWLCEDNGTDNNELRFVVTETGVQCLAVGPDEGSGSMYCVWDLTVEQAGDLADWLAPFLEERKRNETPAQIARIERARKTEG